LSAGSIGGLSSSDNLACACILCNRYKGSDIASIASPTEWIVPLFHPRRDRWVDHFRLAGERITPISQVGSVTLRLLRMNGPERLIERRLLQILGTYPVR
jgi:hypothetical protein